MKRIGKLALMAVPILAAILAFGQAKVHLIHLDSSPAIDAGCPAKVHFSGRIETTGPLEVSYQWLRSDGGHANATLRFAKAESKDVNYTWTLSQHLSGWVQLVILSPSKEQTAKSNFTVDCGPGKK
jgi:hypothetical protein